MDADLGDPSVDIDPDSDSEERSVFWCSIYREVL